MSLPEPIIAITADGPDLEAAVHGAKAVGLQRLMRLGLPVPAALAVPVASARAIAADQTTGRLELRNAVRTLGGPGDRLAVRSGAAVSLPGAFETLLDVLPSVVDAAVVTVVESTRGLRVETIARALGHDRVPETAVVIQRQVDATADERSGAGAATSRHPVTGDVGATGSFVWQVKGDAVMAATTPVLALDSMTDRVPEGHARLIADLARLDEDLGSAVEVEFTVERGELFYLQLRTFEVMPDTTELPAGSLVIAEGQPASAGVGRGQVRVDVDDALDAVERGESVVLVIETSSPSDMTAMVRSAAVLTIMGGRESHAAVVTRGAGVPAVLAVQGLAIGPDHIVLGDRRVEVGDELVVDGTTGRVAQPPRITPNLEAAYAVETPDDNRRLYAEWASTYEASFVAAKAYQYHLRVAEALVAHERPHGPTLDVGCGTGVVGVALRERGVGEIDGVDISPEMLEEARSKGVYGRLIEADLTVGMDVADDTYAAITSAGTFTHGHLPPEPLRELIRVAMPGARCAIGVNAAHFEEFGFAAWLDDAVRDGLIEPYELSLVKVYESSDPNTPDDMSHIVGFTVR